MPRKTRQQKILTELRTLRRELQTPTANPISVEKPHKEAVSPERLSNLMKSSESHSATNQNYQYVLHDLRKVAILATIGLLIEVVLSLTLNFGFAKLIPGLH